MTASAVPLDDSYSLIVVGTGFASSFFLREYLARAATGDRILVLERGHRDPHTWQIEHRRNSRIAHRETFVRAGWPHKDWNFTIAFGGGSNCWWACTPRLLPNDFRLRSLYGVGRDWPVTYDELEEHYQAAEEVMRISGPANGPCPRTRPYPQPAHRLSDPDRLMQQAFPDLYFAQPTARARVATGRRSVCCANGVCNLCPVDAKFTIENGLAEIYDDPRVTLLTGAPALAVETRGDTATSVLFRHQDQERHAATDLVALGTNALFNPAILERSGLTHPLLGRRLHEQIAADVYVDLDGVDNFQGSTVVTGHGYMFYDGEHRREHGACLVEGWNYPDQLRWEPGKTRQLLRLKLIVEDLPEERNRFALTPDEPERPVAIFEGHGDYAEHGLEAARQALPRLLAALPVEGVSFERVNGGTESHILGTTVMGDDPASSVLDRHLIHHQVRNLLVLGGGAFPTSSPANPTLTICALSTWCARHLFEGSA